MKKYFAIALLIVCCSNNNNASSLYSSRTLSVDTLSITGCIGEEYGDSTNTFGILYDAEYHQPTGNIIVLDSYFGCIKEFTPNGVFTRNISRMGSGPGELSSRVMDFFQMGHQTLVMCGQKHGFIIFDDSLNYKEERLLWLQNQPIQSVALTDSTFVAYTIGTESGSGENSIILYRRIARYDYSKEEYNLVFWEDSEEITIADLTNRRSEIFNDFRQGITLGGNENIVLFALRESDSYSVHAWHPNGSFLFTIAQELEPVAKTDVEIAQEKLYTEASFHSMGMRAFDFVPETYRDMILKVDVGPDSNIWIQRGTVYTPFFDIYSMKGELIGHKVFPDSGWSWQFSLDEIGILAWEIDPEDGYQRLYITE